MVWEWLISKKSPTVVPTGSGSRKKPEYFFIVGSQLGGSLERFHFIFWWMMTMVNKSPKDRVVGPSNGDSWLIFMGVILTTETKSWEPILQVAIHFLRAPEIGWNSPQNAMNHLPTIAFVVSCREANFFTTENFTVRTKTARTHDDFPLPKYQAFQGGGSSPKMFVDFFWPWVFFLVNSILQFAACGNFLNRWVAIIYPPTSFI